MFSRQSGDCVAEWTSASSQNLWPFAAGDNKGASMEPTRCTVGPGLVNHFNLALPDRRYPIDEIVGALVDPLANDRFVRH